MAIVVLAILLVLAVPPLNAGLRLLLLLPELFPASPVQALLWVTPSPVRAEVQYPGAEGAIVADLYRPSDAGRHGAVLLFLGVNPVGRNEPILVRTAEGLARAGLVVLIPESARLNRGEISRAEVGDLVAGVRYLREHPDVAPERVGLTGFSVGGSLALLAAADERIADDLAFVNAFGAYADAGALAVSVVASAFELDGAQVPWQAAPLAEYVVVDHIASFAPPAERAAIREGVLAWRAARGSAAEPPTAEALAVESPAGEAVVAFLTAASLAEAEARLRGLPATGLASLHSVSPLAEMGRIRSRIYLMHDLGDPFVPFVASRRLAAAAPAGRVDLTEFAVFEHVEPTRAVDAATLASEAAKLFWHLYRMLAPIL